MVRRALGALLAGVLIFGALLAVFVARHHHCLYDDAYIYLRYARNVASGCGVRWNCDGAPVEGFSSPLYLALLVLGSLFTTKLVLVTTVVSSLALFVAGAAAIAAVADRGSGVLPAVALAALLGADHTVLLNAVVGLDSGLAAAFVMGAWLAVDRGRFRVATALLAAALVVRTECVVFAVVLPFVAPAGRRREIGAALGAALVLVTLGRWLVFHDVLPNTYWAKRGGTAAHARLGLEYLLSFGADFPWIALAPLALLDRGRRVSTAFGLAGAALWCAAFLRTGGDTFPYSRLAFPLVPMLGVLAVRGVFALAARRRAALGVLPIAAAALFAAVTHHIPAQHSFSNVNAWIAVGRYLERTHAGQTVATVPIGAIGYTSRLPVLDLVGLTDRETAKAGASLPPERLVRAWIGHERYSRARFEEVAPDVVVTTKYRAEPWTSLADAEAGFYADWVILRAMKAGEIPYRVADAEIAPGVHWLFFERVKKD